MENYSDTAIYQKRKKKRLPERKKTGKNDAIK